MTRGRRRQFCYRRAMVCVALVLAVCVIALSESPALGAESPGPPIAERPGWELTARTFPTNLSPGSTGTVSIDVFNIGAAASHGEITVTDTLPPGVTAREAGELQNVGDGLAPAIGHKRWSCAGNGPGDGVGGATVVTCINEPEGSEGLSEIAGGGGAPTNGNGIQGLNLDPPIGIAINAGAESTTLENRVAIAGGGASTTATTTDRFKVSTVPAPFGFAGTDAWFSNADGTLDTQAGSHPYEATFSLDLASAVGDHEELLPSGGEPRHLEVKLPPGIIADATAVPRCTRPQLTNEECPQASMIGVDSAYFTSNIQKGFPVFNMAPPPGVAVQFAFSFGGILVFLNSTVRTGSDYGATTTAQLPQRLLATDVLTLWNVPGEASHNLWRNGELGGCTKEQIEQAGSTSQETLTQLCVAPHFPTRKPFLTVPTACGGLTPITFKADDWQNASSLTEATLQLHDSNGAPTQFGECEGLSLAPQVSVAADTAEADAPTGGTIEVKPSLGGLQEPGLRGTSDIRHATVTFPEGVVVNPGRAAGLQACQETPEQSGIGTEDAAHCPPAAKLGTVKIKSPLIEAAEEKELEGTVYLLQSNPPRLHVLVAASADGVNVKLVGITRLDEATGRVVATFGADPTVEAEDPALRGHMALPPLPFSSFKVTLEGGGKSSLVTPSQCGTYTTEAKFEPWASPFIPEFATSVAVGITAGPGGGACPSAPLPFSPSMTAGSSSTEAGAFTDFSLQLQRADGQQRIEKLQFTSPAGLSAMTSTVPLCSEADANVGTCPAASRIGHAVVASGPGSNPLVLPQPGAPELPIYLTGPYKGAPFGLSVVTPIVAGPFNLGTIVTRAKIDVDPTLTQITVTTDPLPQIVKGVPTDLRSIDSIIDRPGFFFNPTNCAPQSFSGTATSAGGAATAPLSSHFAIGACQALKFTPKFTASTSAKTSKANGASFHVKIAYPAGAEANISKVNLTIPNILPTRLTTIQKACTEAQFNLNPAGCPAASRIATAIVHTPVLKSPLSGPVYFVSHGNAAFPDVEMVLQGEGVTLVVDGKTQIKNGVTYSRFETVPDQPFSTFEFNAPQGPYSIFTANGDLCATEVKLPTILTAQNGAVLAQSTPVDVQGCSNALRILSHSIKHRTLTLKVVVPAAGRLTVTGKGLARASKSSKGRSTVTLKLRARARHGRLRTRVKLSFAPSKGRRLSTAVSASFKR